MAHDSIPFVDLRGKTPVDLLRAYPDRARDLVQASCRSWGVWSYYPSRFLLPVADRLSRRWLIKQRNPYLYEIETVAELLGHPGGVALNVCFEWGCTSGVWRTGSTVSLLRILDWPFPGLGKTMLVALQDGRAGTFYNVTWPGMIGIFNAVAPGRFAAAINQAPMRMHGRMFVGDWVTNRLRMRGQTGLPPAHLLRQVFETAGDYEEAKEMLRATPLAIPAIFVLSGIRPGEGCVIERLEDAASVTELAEAPQLVRSNHFMGRLNEVGQGWRPREIDSAGRYRQACTLPPEALRFTDFSWLQDPMLNANTRVAMMADAARPLLVAQGYKGTLPVSALFALGVRDGELAPVAEPAGAPGLFEEV